jgi:hypothetical protein
MNEENVRMPITTDREGNKITKVCVEDVYKLVNKVYDAMDRAYNNSVDVLEAIHKEVGDYEGELIIGTGVSQPCLTDAFDEEIGNSIAFMKAKLNANIKKHNFLCRVYNQYINALTNIDELIENVDEKIKMDLEGVRKHNPDYLFDIELKLGIA